MISQTEEAIQKAKELFINTRHAAIATVNDDGSPHNTPFFFLHEKDLSRVYWGSARDSAHSKNIVRDKKAFLVLYDSTNPKKGGVYMKLEECGELSGDELKTALVTHNQFRAKENKQPLEVAYYQKDSPQRMYAGTPVKFWVLMSENDSNGLRIRDYRHEVRREDLILSDA